LTWDGCRSAGSLGNYLGKKQDVTFLKKSHQKTFAPEPVPFEPPRSNEQKFFASFFQKRSACFLILNICQNAAPTSGGNTAIDS
jgi:hypothetical protein